MRNKLIEKRKSLKLTQKDVAEAINKKRSTVSHYEIGTITPSLKAANKIKSLFEYYDDDLFLNS